MAKRNIGRMNMRWDVMNVMDLKYEENMFHVLLIFLFLSFDRVETAGCSQNPSGNNFLNPNDHEMFCWMPKGK